MSQFNAKHHTLLRWVVGLTGLSFILFFGGAILLIGLDILYRP